MEAIVKTRRVGGSITATLPKTIVNELNIRENNLVKIDVQRIEKDFFGKLKGIGRFSADDELRAHD